MKKLLALILAMVLVLGLVACGNNEETETPDTTTVDSTVDNSGNENLPEDDDEETDKHVHSYSSQIVTAESCTEDGEYVYTCECGDTYNDVVPARGHNYAVTDSRAATCTGTGYSEYGCECGSSYTEETAATGHKMSGWKAYTAATTTSAGEDRNTCENCGEYESRLNCDTMFKHYASILMYLPSFSAAQDLQDMQNYSNIITAALRNGVENTNETTDQAITTVTVASLNTYTQKRFGTSFDYTEVSGLSVCFGKAEYDSATSSVVVKSELGVGDYTGEVKGVTYTTSDNTRFTVTYKYENSSMQTIENNTFTVELADSNYVITSHNKK